MPNLRSTLIGTVLLAAGCGGDDGPGPYPAADAWAPNLGPGAPAQVFSQDALFESCSYLDGGERDVSDHHNMVTMYDGYLLMPWAPEWGGGGLTFYDISDPCAPVTVGTGYSAEMRETHSIGFTQQDGRRFAVVNHVRLTFDLANDDLVGGGLQIWDITDSSAPQAISKIELPGFFFPDAYARVTLSVFWHAPFIYAAGADNGVYVVDASDPENPFLVTQHVFDPVLRAGQVQAVGNLMIVTAAEGDRTALLDISDPSQPQPIPGGDFQSLDGEGEPRDAYFTNFMGGYVFYARKESGGGVMIYDVRDPTTPTYSGDFRSEGNGGYVFVKDDLAFVGESHHAVMYDVHDHTNIVELARMDLVGDLDTVVPIGNLAVLSVDDKAEKDKGTSIAPYAQMPDSEPPEVRWVWPDDGSTGLPTTSRFGVSFQEFVDPRSAWAGSVRLYETGTEPDSTRVEGYISTQEVIVNFAPRKPLKPNTQYTFELPAGGIVDFNGHALSETFSATFTTGAR